ncbi:hypothetical protein [aff. Roholtiella sp. LEGE 12411]|uniref:hypothetical protein n=1 Tax=aff. Roholtiella sp. LEGE 12411 TaxID=1828822 RepID=UPI00187EE246|nr:hypothetical protein [aff. Roholtiella sp. LEGE 12411]MBE9036023.1 hypothetical protein [aff. Roholtiella sp. LEGE 12411]
MSKVVAGKSPRGHYTQISNALIRNSEIDDSTFRLICWMTSHDEGFEVNFTNIQISLGYGRDKLRKILKNAEIHNHLIRRKIRTSSGLFDFEYHVFKDTEDAIAYSRAEGIAFRESLPQAELTSDLFSGGGSTRGGLSGGGSTRGGQSTPVYIEEQYKENQKEEEKKREEDSPTPQAESIAVESEDFFKPEPLVLKPEPLTLRPETQNPKPQQLTLLTTQSESSHQKDNPSSRSTVPGLFDNHEQANKSTRSEKRVTDEQICCLFLEAYNANKPSNFTEHRQINAEHIKKIKHLVKDFPDIAIEMFADALVWVREQEDGWWRQKQFSLSNLMTNGKILDYADKHATAMKYDAKYRARVEGKAPSMDKGRFSVIDDNGNESTGATADIARLYATDPMFRMLMDAGK